MYSREPRSFLTLRDITSADLEALVARSVSLASGGPVVSASLKDRAIGVLFTKTSTRTRTSFTLAAQRLGAHVVQYGPGDLQVNTGESLADTARVLSQYLDGLVVRSSGPMEDLRTLAGWGRMCVVNAMSREEHPTQAIGDLAVILERFGGLSGLHVVYVGEGNNTAVALAIAIARIGGLRLTLLTPPGYGLPSEVREVTSTEARTRGGEITEVHDPGAIPSDGDIIYTTRWQTTGTHKPDPLWRETFRPFTVTQDLFEACAKGPDTVFMHDLPAHRGEDVTSAVIDGSSSIAFRQAEFKLYAAIAVLEWCFDVARTE